MKLKRLTVMTSLQGKASVASLLVACMFMLIGCNSEPASFQMNEAYIRAVEYKADVTKPQLISEQTITLSEAQKKNISKLIYS